MSNRTTPTTCRTRCVFRPGKCPETDPRVAGRKPTASARRRWCFLWEMMLAGELFIDDWFWESQISFLFLRFPVMFGYFLGWEWFYCLIVFERVPSQSLPSVSKLYGIVSGCFRNIPGTSWHVWKCWSCYHPQLKHLMGMFSELKTWTAVSMQVSHSRPRFPLDSEFPKSWGLPHLPSIYRWMFHSKPTILIHFGDSQFWRIPAIWIHMEARNTSLQQCNRCDCNIL